MHALAQGAFLSGRYWSSWRANPEHAQLSRGMVGYWANFITNGDPNGALLPLWQGFGKDGLAQELGRRIGPEPVPRVGAFRILQRFLDSRLQKAGQ